jgi:2'-5' RNA ligase
MARLFIAVELPAALAEDLLRVVPAQRGIRPTAAAQLHLTLRFLGEQDEAAAARIDDALRQVIALPMSLQVRGVGRFRSRQGAILWAGLEESVPLMVLFDAIGAALESVGIPPEGRRFWPHLTLARCRPEVPERVLRDWLSAHRDLSSSPWFVARFVLFESFLDRTGARHEVRAIYPLASLSQDC